MKNWFLNQLQDKVVDYSGKFEYPNTKVTEKDRPPQLFPQWLRKAKKDEYFKNFFGSFKEHHINLSLLDVLWGIPQYDKYLNGVVMNKIKL